MKSAKNPAEDNVLPRRALLDLESGNRPGLQRAMQHLLGHKARRGSASGSEQLVLKVLLALNFEVVAEGDGEEIQLTHPLTIGRLVKLTLPPDISENSTEEVALDFALKHFPEMDFYLPYITTRARYVAARKKNQPAAPLGPEPDYDEDGFIALP